MRANELRLGNWVKYIPKDGMEDALYRGHPNFYQVTCVGCGDKVDPLPQLYLQGTGSCLSLHDFDSVAPIPLTEELLLKCGFNEFGGRECSYYAKYNLYEKSYLNGFAIEKRGNGFYLLSKFELQIGEEFNNLHQLQNLYFALTGKELDVKL